MEFKYSNKICAYLLTAALYACNTKHLPDNTKHFPKHFLIGKAFWTPEKRQMRHLKHTLLCETQTN